MLSDLSKAIEYALDGSAILFTGSGFSYGCTNNLPAPDNQFPLGKALRDLLARDLKITTTSDLKTVSQFYVQTLGAEVLLNRLTEVFTLKEATDDQKEIMSIPWKRVYTTNYDRVAEIMAEKNGFILESLTLSSDYYNPQNRKACVHLNGSITNLTPETLMSEFKLTDSSYNAEELNGKSWFEFMKRDFESAKVIFIVGFSKTQDLDISRILARPAYKNKVIFINKPGLDEIEKAILKPIGPVYDIGLTAFAESIREAKNTFITSPDVVPPFESFIYQHMEPSDVDNAAFDELTDFYYKGILSDAVFRKDATGEYSYITYRKPVRLFLDNLNNKRAFIVVSTLGNGKTVFCRMIREELRKKDIDVFTFVKDGVDIDTEIMAICNRTYTDDKTCRHDSHSSRAASPSEKKRRIVVIIDDYNAHMDVINKFADFDTDKIVFLLTTRRSNQETNNQSLKRTLCLAPEEVKPLYLYTLENLEAEALIKKLRLHNLLPSKHAGMKDQDLASYFRYECKNSIASIVLDLFNSSLVKERLKEMLEKIMGKETKYSQLCILGLASSVMNLHLSYSDMLELLDADYYALLANQQGSILREIFDADKDKFVVSSSIIARVMMNEIVPLDKLTEVLEIVVKKADEISPVINAGAATTRIGTGAVTGAVTTSSKTDKWTEIIKAILSHRNFERFIAKDETKLRSVKHFYDSVKETTFCKNNPFYWEQFAIIYQEGKEFAAAEHCLENADTVAKRIRGFVPFQIETIRGDLILDETIYEVMNISADECIERIVEAEKHFMKYYDHPENEHIRVFSNSRKILVIYEQIKNRIGKSGLSTYIQIMTEIVKNIYDYKTKEKGDNYDMVVDKLESEFRASMDDAKNRLKAK